MVICKGNIHSACEDRYNIIQPASFCGLIRVFLGKLHPPPPPIKKKKMKKKKILHGWVFPVLSDTRYPRYTFLQTALATAVTLYHTIMTENNRSHILYPRFKLVI